MRFTFVVFAAAAVLGCNSQQHNSSGAPSQATNAGAEQANAAAPVDDSPVVPAARLLADYKGNEVAADNRWKGKTVRIQGLVGEIKKDLMDSIYVTIGTGADFEMQTVQCFAADGQSDGFAQLKKGARITMKGRVDGLMMNVLVKDCTIVPTPAPTAPAVAQAGAPPQPQPQAQPLPAAQPQAQPAPQPQMRPAAMQTPATIPAAVRTKPRH